MTRAIEGGDASATLALPSLLPEPEEELPEALQASLGLLLKKAGSSPDDGCEYQLEGGNGGDAQSLDAQSPDDDLANSIYKKSVYARNPYPLLNRWQSLPSDGQDEVQRVEIIKGLLLLFPDSTELMKKAANEGWSPSLVAALEKASITP